MGLSAASHPTVPGGHTAPALQPVVVVGEKQFLTLLATEVSGSVSFDSWLLVCSPTS